MTDAEKKAREYYENGVVNGDSQDDRSGWTDCFMAGASYALSNQWRDAEKEKSEREQTVLIVFQDVFGHYLGIGFYDIDYKKSRSFNIDNKFKPEVLAWLEIPEYKPKGE